MVSITPLAWQRGEGAPERRVANVIRLAEADLARQIGAVLEGAVEAANRL